MAYQGLTNNANYIAEQYLQQDENGRDLLIIMAKVTYAYDVQGRLVMADEAAPIIPEGEYWADPENSSLKYAPEGTFAKQATDIALIGHACSPGAQPTRQLDVGLQVGNLRKIAKVFGDRYWVKSAGMFGSRWSQTQAVPFSKMPLLYELAFGGEDLTPTDPKHHAYEARNPVGAGMIAEGSKLSKVKLPNIEAPNQLIQAITDRPEPTGFGFIAPNWQPRMADAGSYDEAWQKTRLPQLPGDFNRRFFNAASPGLIADGYLLGNEAITLHNLSAHGQISFYLPGHKPAIHFAFARETAQPLTVNLDSLIINSDQQTVELLWRAEQDVYQRIYEIETVTLTSSRVTQQQAIA